MSEELKKWTKKASKGIYETNQEKWNISTVWNILTDWGRSEHRYSSKLDIVIKQLEVIQKVNTLEGAYFHATYALEQIKEDF
jgi:hypothetical protein